VNFGKGSDSSSGAYICMWAAQNPELYHSAAIWFSRNQTSRNSPKICSLCPNFKFGV